MGNFYKAGAAAMTSNTDDWATPQDLFDRLNSIHHFTLDPCASDKNAKCAKYYTREDDGLAQDWGGGVRILQPALRENHRRVGAQSLQRKQETRDQGGDATACQNRHQVVP